MQVVATNAAPSEGWDPSIQPPEILLGVLSSDIRLAVRALRDWANALHVPFVIPTSRVTWTNSSWLPTLHYMLSWHFGKHGA